MIILALLIMIVYEDITQFLTTLFLISEMNCRQSIAEIHNQNACSTEFHCISNSEFYTTK